MEFVFSRVAREEFSACTKSVEVDFNYAFVMLNVVAQNFKKSYLFSGKFLDFSITQKYYNFFSDFSLICPKFMRIKKSQTQVINKIVNCFILSSLKTIGFLIIIYEGAVT